MTAMRPRRLHWFPSGVSPIIQFSVLELQTGGPWAGIAVSWLDWTGRMASAPSNSGLLALLLHIKLRTGI